MQYEVVKAKTHNEAIEKGEWQPGVMAECIEVKAIANSDGTYTLIPMFKRAEQ